MTDVYDSYELETGLKQEFDLTIASAKYQYDAGYNSGQTLVLLLEGIDSDGDAQRLLYPCSPGWVDGQGGQVAEREDGAQNRKFNQNSGVGGLIIDALQAGAPLRERGPSTHAAIWVGLAFHFARKELNPDSEYKTTRALPTKFLGIGAVPAAAAAPIAQPIAAPVAAPVAAAPVAAPVANGNGGGEVGALMTAKLKALAKRCDTHDAFIEEGLSLAEGNPAVEAVLGDPAQYAALRA